MIRQHTPHRLPLGHRANNSLTNKFYFSDFGVYQDLRSEDTSLIVEATGQRATRRELALLGNSLTPTSKCNTNPLSRIAGMLVLNEGLPANFEWLALSRLTLSRYRTAA